MNSVAVRAKILLVEDDTAVHCALTGVLTAEGHEVVHAYDGHEAIAGFLLHDDIGLVLLDLQLPILEGWDVLEPLTRLRPTVPIIVITARPNQLLMANAAGAAALMEKPLDLPTLVTAIRETLAETEVERLERLHGTGARTRHLSWQN